MVYYERHVEYIQFLIKPNICLKLIIILKSLYWQLNFILVFDSRQSGILNSRRHKSMKVKWFKIVMPTQLKINWTPIQPDWWPTYFDIKQIKYCLYTSKQLCAMDEIQSSRPKINRIKNKRHNTMQWSYDFDGWHVTTI